MMHDVAQPDVIVVGGGPAGMIAAGRAAELGCSVLLLEKNAEPGRKLAITGGGRCNVTNATADRHELVARYGDRGKALHSVFTRFSPDDMRTLLARYGLGTKVEDLGRVFPVTDRAEDVRTVLQRYMHEGGVEIRTGVDVESLLREPADGAIGGVVTRAGQQIRSPRVIVATGGVSRPETGSTGDGLRWVAALGVRVEGADPSLVPIRVGQRWVRSLQGLALEDAALAVEVRDGGRAEACDERAWANARRELVRRGKLLFTHFGLSGPLVLNAASQINVIAETHPGVRLTIGLVPAKDSGALDRELVALCTRAGSRTVRRVLATLVPERIAVEACRAIDLDPGERAATLSREMRKRLARWLTSAPCAFDGLMGQEKAVVSSGGVDPAAVDFRTMEVRGHAGLYLAGDLLAFDRRSGGYSLQVCWSSGWVAGNAVASATRS